MITRGMGNSTVDAKLIGEAEMALSVEDLQPFTSGGQKYVARGRLGLDEIVLKVVELTGAHAAVTLERARREVDLLARIDHPNVVRVVTGLEELGGSPPTGVAWLEEFLEGEDMRARLGPRWDWPPTAAMALDVAQGLAAMHAEKAVHRDLSPGNVRCTSAGPHVVMDPGFARHFEQSTLTGVFQPGTPGYMTPEHVSLTRPTPASDVFGVGILMYQALTGVLPFAVGIDFDQYRANLRDDQAASVHVARPDLEPEQAAIVDRCLQRQSARRYLNGAELVAALEAL